MAVSLPAGALGLKPISEGWGLKSVVLRWALSLSSLHPPPLTHWFIFHTQRLFPALRRLRSCALLCAFIALCPAASDAYLPGTACVTPVAVVSADLRCWLKPCVRADVCACVPACVRMCVCRRSTSVALSDGRCCLLSLHFSCHFSPQALTVGPVALCFFPLTLECF